MTKKKISFAIFCILTIFVLDCIALFKGIDGVAFISAESSIFFLAGYVLKGLNDKNKIDKLNNDDNTIIKNKWNMM